MEKEDAKYTLFERAKLKGKDVYRFPQLQADYVTLDHPESIFVYENKLVLPKGYLQGGLYLRTKSNDTLAVFSHESEDDPSKDVLYVGAMGSLFRVSFWGVGIKPRNLRDAVIRGSVGGLERDMFLFNPIVCEQDKKFVLDMLESNSKDYRQANLYLHLPQE